MMQCNSSITSRKRLDCALTAAKLYGMNSTTAALMASLPSSTSSKNFLATLHQQTTHLTKLLSDGHVCLALESQTCK